MTMNNDDKNQPYGKLKWSDLVILLGILIGATTFLLFYFK
jgi:hypothetical protein